MQDNVARYLENAPGRLLRRALQFILNPIADRLSSVNLVSAGLAIHGAGSPVVKAGNNIYAFAKGTPVYLAAADLPALVGSVTNAKFNVFCFYIDSGANVTVAMGTEGAAFTNVVFPTVPAGKAWLGFVVINPTGAGNFVGGTTNLDDGTVIPNAVYVNLFGGSPDQTILTGV